MKLLMLNYEFPPIGGGGGQAHHALLKEFAGRPDLTVDVLTSAPKPGFFLDQFADNIRVHKVGIRKKELHFWRRSEVLAWLLKARPHYRRLLRENTYDLVHAFFDFTAGCCVTARQAALRDLASRSDAPATMPACNWSKVSVRWCSNRSGNGRRSLACSEGLRQRALRSRSRQTR